MEQKNGINIWLGGALIVFIALSLIIGLFISFGANLLLNGKVKAARPAKLEVTILKDQNCQECFDPTPFIEAIKKENIKITQEKNIDIASNEGQELIKKYSIAKAPTVIITGEIEKNEALKNIWPKLGEVKDGVFILRNAGTPYVLISSGEIKGKVKLIEIVDSKCKECFDVSQNEVILKNYGVYLEDVKAFDLSLAEGQKLVKDYNINLLPTIILTGDLGDYADLNAVWPQVGTIEKDGAYVLRQGVKQMGTYKDLTTGKIITPVATTKK